MKTTTTLFLFLFCTILFFSQCKKDETTPTPTPATNFSPLTLNSSWVYKSTDSATGTVTIDTMKATNNMKTFNGRSYTILVGSLGDSSFLTKSGNDYYRIFSLFATGVEEHYLRDNAAVNDTFNNVANVNIPVPPPPAIPTTNLAATVYANHKLVSNTETKIVNGKTYTNVMHVRLDLRAIATFPPFNQSIGYGDFYYANGVGLISDHTTIGIDYDYALLSISYHYHLGTTYELLSSDIK